MALGPLRSCWESEGGWWRLFLEGQCVSGPDWTRNSTQDWQEFPRAGWERALSLDLETSARHILSWEGHHALLPTEPSVSPMGRRNPLPGPEQLFVPSSAPPWGRKGLGGPKISPYLRLG